MDSIENWLFPGTAISTVLRIRPLAISVFEKFGIDPWDPKVINLDQLCAANGIPLVKFFEEIKTLPMPGYETKWKTKSVSHLLDFLTRQHRKLIHGLLPIIKQNLTQENVGNGESLRRLRYLVEEWPTFSAALAKHIHEEESILFPKILQYEYCLRHKTNNPDLFSGSLNVYIAQQMVENEKCQMAAIKRFRSEVKFSSASPEAPGSLEVRLKPLLEDLEFNLLNHAGLELNVLFPMAIGLEKSLMITRNRPLEGKNSTKVPSRFEVTYDLKLEA
ncbi:MAG: hemerythrin domain-containing protein [Fibrobacterota bacterium]|nr:hemerythrin domain-containing protein [Fibrobacterota bacterium]